MKTRRAKYGDLFSMAIVGDLTAPDVFDDVVQDVDVVIHVASVGLSPSCRSFDGLVADRGSRSPSLTSRGPRILNSRSFFRQSKALSRS
jgi:hypothetical protein